MTRSTLPLSMLGIAVIVLVVSCATPVQSAREAFLAGSPKERTRYHRLYEVSPDALEAHAEELSRVTRAITQGIREESTAPALEERLKRIDLVAQADRSDKSALVARLREVYVPTTDSVLFYHYWSDKRQEFGYMVTRGATIKRKIIMGEGVGKIDLP